MPQPPEPHQAGYGTQVRRFLGGGGEAAALIDAHDWAGTPLGAIDSWPRSLRTTVGLLVRAPMPMVLLWGMEGVLLYNDAYALIAGPRHPAALGSRVRESWPEVADFNDHVIRTGLAGATLQYTDQELTLLRKGIPEQTWFSLHYTPVLDDSETPAGVLAVVTETTDRVLSERWQAQDRDRLRQMFEQSPGFMALLRGPQHTFDLVNPAYLQLIGHRNVIGASVRDALPELAGQGFYELLDGVYASGKVFKGEGLPVTLQRAPGEASELRFVDFIYQPIRSAAGDVIGIFVDGVDVTELRTALLAADANAEQFRTFAQTLPNHVWTAPPDGLLDWFNDRVYEYSGATPGQLDGQGWSEIVHPDDLPAAGAAWAAALASGKAYETEFRLRRADGVYLWHLARAMPIRSANGEIIRWVGTNTDINKRRLAGAESARDRDRIWALSQELMLVCTRQGMILAVNPSGTRILGWSREEMVGQPVSQFVHPDDVEITSNEVERLAAGQTTSRFENRFRTRDGAYRTLNWTAVPDGEQIHGIARDVTEQRDAESALRQAQKMEAVGQLTGGLAHDFNNLLAAIGGSVEVVSALVKRGRIGEIDRYLTAAQNSTRRAAALTQRLLAFSRRQTLDPKATDVNRLISGMEELIRRTVGPAVLLEVVGAGGLWLTKIDSSQLESSLLNLCINARDAMAPDGGRLTIETANKWLDERGARDRDLPPGQYISLCVTDTGTGMTQEVIERAFDPFFTTKPLGEGTGLGLSMVYGFARQSGGQIRIYSELGKGTTMCIYLPRYIGVLDEVDPVETIHAPEHGHGETVLVVDDEPTIRMLIKDVLLDNGYIALEAADGPAALKILQSSRRLDLLITDVGLPGGVNGRQLADAARVSRKNLKVLFITGYAENAAIGNGHLEPGMELLTKPFAIATLGDKIRALIAKSISSL